MLKFMPMYQRFLRLQAEIFDLCKKHVDAAMRRVSEEDQSVLAKLVWACGPDSSVPLIMGVNALQVGIDSTASTATFPCPLSNSLHRSSAAFLAEISLSNLRPICSSRCANSSRQ